MRSYGRSRISFLVVALAAWLGWSVAGGETPSTPTTDATAEPATATTPREPQVYFNGVEPGVSTVADVEAAWGKPIHGAKDKGQLRNSYAMEPFERAEVLFDGERVEAIIIYLKEQLAPDQLAEELELSPCEPVTVYGNNGAAVGQAYPERGVALSFQTGVEPPRVVRIMIERPSAEAFVLRARNRVAFRTAEALDDVAAALDVQPSYAAAHALEAEIFSSLGRHENAQASIARALAGKDPQPEHRLLAARIAAELGDFDKAVEATQKVIGSGPPAAVKARAICQLGDLLSSGPNQQYKLAMDYHLDAIKLAQAVQSNGPPAARRMARSVALDAHLAVARDIALGQWRMKPQVVDEWLDRAVGLANESRALGDGELIDAILISQHALAACAVLEGQLDPTPWTESLLASGRRALEKSHDASAVHRIEWQMALGLFDAMRTFADRGDYEIAVTHGERAAKYFEALIDERQLTAAERYTLGRLYFRLGSIAAVSDQDHNLATEWFNRSLAELAKSSMAVPPGDMRRAGDTLVSMSVSFWAIGEQEKAVSLTRQGVQWIQRAVDDGLAEERSLAVPYANMATMLRFRGDDKKAGEFETMAARVDPTKMR